MKAILKIAIACLVYIPAWAQWNDNFSDGDFTANPEWQGSASEFIVEAEMLRLNAPADGSPSYLVTASEISLDAQWNFWVKLDFNPSGSNYMKVYLMSDVVDLNTVNNGYFIKIGGTPDEISLYKVVNGSETLLIDGVDKRVDLASVEVSIEVTRDASGLWQMRSKLSGESDFVAEATATDLELTKSAYFGVMCTYSPTRSTKMYFDDISVTGKAYLDVDPPILLSYATPSANAIQLAFDEPLDPVESTKPAHYALNDVRHPASVVLESEISVLLDFPEAISLVNELKIAALPDIAGNPLDTTLQVVYVDQAPHQFREVVFNELFPDPSPPEDLPEYEFVELINRSDRVIDLEGWAFMDGSTVALLPRKLLFPDSILILCKEEAVPDYEPYGSTLGLSSWPSLNNGGDILKLTDDKGVAIDSLSYTLDWYKDSDKKEGGWSLEQVDPDSKCLGIYNWAASTDASGGTPGRPNSVFVGNGNSGALSIKGAMMENDSVEVWLSKPVAPGGYIATVFPGQEVLNFNLNSPEDHLIARMVTDWAPDQKYSIETELEDCKGNTETLAHELIPISRPQKGDIVINELLFDPYTGGSDFVELLNTTANVFNLEGLALANETNSDIVSDTVLLLKPGHYIALSEDVIFLTDQYLAPDSSLFETDLPTMPNDEGIVVLKDRKSKTLDSVYYSETYHFTLLDDVEGISLERILPQGDSNNPDNWKSAAETARFATPGYVNSQSSTITVQGKVTISPEVITPNNDGQADFCQIIFELTGLDKVVSVHVYNLNGQLIKTLANNSWVASQGFFTWDGTNDQGGMLPTAHYIVVSEIVGSDGRTQMFRNKVVVANGF